MSDALLAPRFPRRGGRVQLCWQLLFTAGCCEFSGPRYHGPKTDHFDGQRFDNFFDNPGPASAFLA